MSIDWTRMIPEAAQKAAEVAAEQDRIRARRDAAIHAGITVEGLFFDTGEVSQQRILAAALSAMTDPGYAVQWKLGDRFVRLDAPAILAAARAIRDHVQACFDREAELLADLAAAQTFDGPSDRPFDPEAGWPGSTPGPL